MRSFDKSYGTRKYILPLVSGGSDEDLRSSISNMYTYLDDYMNTLVLELSRIEETNRKIDEIANRSVEKFEERLLFTYLWADYYFFLNTLERAYHIARRLYLCLDEEEKEKRIKESTAFKNAKAIRNSIEHLDERITRSTGEEFYAQHRSMGGENEITISGVTFAAKEDSLQLLYQIYDDISNIIAEKYIEPNREEVDKIESAMLQSRFGSGLREK